MRIALLNDRGIALGVVLMTAVIFSVAAFAVLTMALSGQQRLKVLSKDHLSAQYAAEAGVVWVMQRLWNDPTYCANNTPLPSPPNPINGLTVNVTVTNCGANNPHQINAKVIY